MQFEYFYLRKPSVSLCALKGELVVRGHRAQDALRVVLDKVTQVRGIIGSLHFKGIEVNARNLRNGCASSAPRGNAKWREDARSRKTLTVAAIAREASRDKKKEDERKIVPESFPEN